MRSLIPFPASSNQTGDFVLRQVVQSALEAGVQVALLAETLSDPSDDVVSSMMDLLGPDMSTHIKVYSASLNHASADEGADQASSSVGLEASMTAAAAKLKQQGAESFVAQYQQALQDKNVGISVTIDPQLLAAAGKVRVDVHALLHVSSLLVRAFSKQLPSIHTVLLSA